MKLKHLITFKNKYRSNIYLLLIIISAFYFRSFNINWDNNYYFHPDERAIIMFVTPIAWPSSIQEFINVNSPLNPHFFAYGNMPIYLLKIAGEIASTINPIFKEYGGLHIVGRGIMATVDTGTVLIVYLIASAVFSRRTGLFAALLYALSVFPIQASHFYAVDPLLTFLTAVTLLFSIKLINKPKFTYALIVGTFLGLALATKVSALVFLLPIILGLFLSNAKRKKFSVLKFSMYFLILLFAAFFFFVFTQPYAVIDMSSFVKQTQLQSQMSNNAFIFPYTLQYFDKAPYYYEIKNIFLWGLGPVGASFCFLGVVALAMRLRKMKPKQKNAIIFLIISFTCYFILFGKFAVGFMRYMLPIYPLLCIFGGYFISEICFEKIPHEYLLNYFKRKSVLILFLLLLLTYPVSFMHIYVKPNTRIQASEWINKNIPAGSKVAIEHWDDALPVYGNQNYTTLTLPLYDPDTAEKWIGIDLTLKNTDYIFIASNRLYTPLMKMTDCKKLPPGRCYARTAQYYKALFDGKLGFSKIAEFTEYPTLPFTNIKLVDDSADESFSVYDHPKIMIFKKD